MPVATFPFNAWANSGRLPKLVPPGAGSESATAVPVESTTTTRPPVSHR